MAQFNDFQELQDLRAEYVELEKEGLAEKVVQSYLEQCCTGIVDFSQVILDFEILIQHQCAHFNDEQNAATLYKIGCSKIKKQGSEELLDSWNKIFNKYRPTICKV